MGKTVTLSRPPVRLRAAAYCRVENDSEEKILGLTLQTEYFKRKFSRSPDVEMVEIFTDSGNALKDSDRPGFERMIEQCKQGKIDIIYTKSLSRFARDIVTSVHLMRELRSWGIKVVFEDEQFDSDNIDFECIFKYLGNAISRKR